MREGWREVELGQLAAWSSGTYIPKDARAGGPVPVYGANGIIGYTQAATHNELLVTVGRVGAVGAVHFVRGPAWVTDNALVARPRDGVDPAFLYAVLTGTDFSPLVSGTNQPLITQSRVKGVMAKLPPLHEQRRIVDLIGAIDDAIEKSEASAGTVESAASAYRERSFAVEGEASVALSEVSTFAGGAAFPPGEQGDIEGSVPFLKVSDMNLPGNEVRIRSAANRVSEATLERLRVRKWPPGTVIFPKVGAALLTEKRRLLTEPSAFDNNVMGLVPTSVEPSYLLGFMLTVRLGEVAQPGAVPSVNQSHLRALRMPAHTTEQRAKIIGLLDRFEAASTNAREEVTALRSLRDKALSALLSGAHGIPDSYDDLMEA